MPTLTALEHSDAKQAVIEAADLMSAIQKVCEEETDPQDFEHHVKMLGILNRIADFMESYLPDLGHVDNYTTQEQFDGLINAFNEASLQYATLCPL